MPQQFPSIGRRAQPNNARCAPALLVLLTAGCQSNTATIDMENTQQAAFVRMMMPQSIEVQSGFTKPIRLKGEGAPDSIEVSLATRDQQGDEMKAIGTFFFELHTVRRASGDRVGDQLCAWEVRVDSADALRSYWDKFSRYYKFPLQLTQGAVLPPGKYILAVRFVSPWGEKLFTEHDLNYDAPPGQAKTSP